MELQETPQNNFFVGYDPIMQSATDALMLLSKVGKIYIKAEGDLILPLLYQVMLQQFLEYQ